MNYPIQSRTVIRGHPTNARTYTTWSCSSDCQCNASQRLNIITLFYEPVIIVDTYMQRPSTQQSPQLEKENSLYLPVCECEFKCELARQCSYKSTCTHTHTPHHAHTHTHIGTQAHTVIVVDARAVRAVGVHGLSHLLVVTNGALV
jgi:hypothetical protein